MQLAIFNEGQGRHDGCKEPIDAAADGFCKRLGRAFEWNVRGGDACSHSKLFGIDVGGRASACRCVVKRIGLGLHFGNQVFHILEAFAGRHHHHVGQAGQGRDAHQVVQGVVGQVGVNGRVHHVARRVNQKRVAIGRCLGHLVGCNGAACARFVFNDDRMTQSGGEFFGHRAGHNVGTAAGRKGHHKLDALLGPILGLRRHAESADGNGCQGKFRKALRDPCQCLICFHVVSIEVWVLFACGRVGHGQQNAGHGVCLVHELALFARGKTG